MKTTAFKVFASCAAIVCFASSAASRATSENPIEGVEQHKNLVGQEDFVMDLKRYISWSIANEMEQIPATAVHEESHRQRRSYDHELDTRLRKELEGDDSPDTIEPTSRDAVQIDPDGQTFREPAPEYGEGTLDSEQSNDIPEPQQSNDIEEPQQSYSGQDSQQSNDIEEPQLSNSGQDSQPLEDSEVPEDSDDVASYVESGEPYEPYEADRDDVSIESGGNSYPDASRKGN